MSTSQSSKTALVDEDGSSGKGVNPRVDLNVVHQYESMQQEQRAVMNKLAEIDNDRHEHILVFEALKEMSPERICHRLIGGVLTQRTVGDVKGKLEAEIQNLDKLMEVLQEHLKNKEKAIESFVSQHREQLGSAVHTSGRGGKDATTSNDSGAMSHSNQKSNDSQVTSAGLLV